MKNSTYMIVFGGLLLLGVVFNRELGVVSYVLIVWISMILNGVIVKSLTELKILAISTISMLISVYTTYTDITTLWVYINNLPEYLGYIIGSIYFTILIISVIILSITFIYGLFIMLMKYNITDKGFGEYVDFNEEIQKWREE